MGDLLRLIAGADGPAVADALLRLDEKSRRALVPTLRSLSPSPASDALCVAGAACLPRAAQIVSWLRRFPDLPGRTVTAVVDVLAAPGRPSMPAVANGLATRLNPRDPDWPLTAAVLRAADVPPPATPGMVAGWIRSLSSTVPRTLAARLAADPWLNALLPAVFELPGLGTCLDDAWPAALLRLATAGRIDRAALIRLVLQRLRDGDKPGALRPILEIHRLLDPALPERAAHAPDYLALLRSPLALATLGQQTLHMLDDAGRLDPSALTEASAAVLTRTEKKLVRAQLAWLDEALDRHPEAVPELLSAAATGLSNPRIDLAEQALRLLRAHPGGLDRLRSELPSLSGDLRRQASEALGLAAAPRAPSFAPAPKPYAPGPMPPPALDPPASPFDIERLLAGLVEAAAVSPDAVAPFLPQLTDLAPDDGPLGLLGARVAELAAQFDAGRPPPFLLAYPSLRDGHVDPARVLFRLAAADADGWQPGRLDLAQALLRLPRRVDAAVTGAAARLCSPAGRRFATWLREGGLPDPPVTVTVLPGPPMRRLATLPCLQLPSGPLPPPAFPVDAPIERAAASKVLCQPPPLPGGEKVKQPGLTIFAGHPPTEGWPMVLPGHREIVAAHVQPFLVPAADQDHHGGTGVLPALARAGGPFGPAMALCLAYGLAARYEQDRRPAVDALLHLASTGGLDAPLVGRELGQLLTAGRVVLGRIVPALAQVQRDGAPHVVWTIARTLVPVLLRMDRPPQATPDLLALAASAAAAIGAAADLPEVAALAAHPGRTRLVTEAGRLARTLTG
ncbi:hypothetical protein ACIA5C_07865 [Actinoplanes sp. NPDC051343]|uniref:hypothetical protein n=1 Tax=Actinoplanes sp. NPDC051343 TaxID=3363906 RepID=UPI0037908326